MTMVTPPRTTELLLNGLGAHSPFSQPLMGDLVEEFAHRADRDGVIAARRWYNREAARAVPYLMRAWVRGLRGAEMRRQASLLFAAWFLTVMLSFLCMGMANSVLSQLGITPRLWSVHTGDQGAMVGLLVIAAVTSLVSGYIAAWLDADTPLASAISLGIVWSSLGIITTGVRLLTGSYPGPVWYAVAAALVTLVGPACGGLLHVGRSRALTGVI